MTHFPLGLQSDPLAQGDQFNSGLALGIVALPSVKCSGVTIKTMKLHRTKKASTATLTPEGAYTATVTMVTCKAKEGTEAPETVELQFTLNEVNQHITRPYPAKIEGRSPLLRDAKVILGRDLTREEDEEGFDPVILKDRTCRVVVAHRRGSNGRLQAQATTVLAPVAAAPAAAVEAVAAVTA